VASAGRSSTPSTGCRTAAKFSSDSGPLGPRGGRPPAGFYTRRTAEEALAAIVTDARRGTLPAMHRTNATFADAAAEFLRYVEQVRKREPSTVRETASASP
jgi:hypothetical protein